MIEIPTRAGQHLAVLGLGASGIAAARALRASGAAVSAWDDGAEARRNAEAAGIATGDLAGCDFAAFDGLVMSPGIPLTHPAPHPVAARARAAGCPVFGDIELLWEACPDATFIGITGTNGKSTTTALVGHLLGGSGRAVAVGGNLGPPALSLEPLGAGGVYVLELSSYQLDLTERAVFDIAVLVNVSPDHLDRHGGMDGYVAAKRRIFRDRADGGQTAIVGVDDPVGTEIIAELKRRGTWRIIPVSSGRAVAGGVYVIDGQLFDATAGAARPVCDLSAIDTLPGAHNWQNAAAAFAATRVAGLGEPQIATRLASYPGLPHRQETVARIGGVRYVNDSKATNPAAAARALACYEPVYWIAGGLAKEGGLGPVADHAGRIRHAFLIGEAAEHMAAELHGKVATTLSGDLATALAAARALADAEGIPGATVLLSPACASFDQFRNFTERGDAFRALIAAVERVETAP